jgi:XTP/dITP diphosphohydrolase
MNRWVLATTNPGKLKEFQAALRPALARQDISLVSQADLGIEAAEEPFDRFEDNALAKAVHAARQANMPAIADDSGLCVDALAGAPGVYSARYFQRALDAAIERHVGHLEEDAEYQLMHQMQMLPPDEANLQWLLHQMRDCQDRSARYVVVIAFVRHAEDPAPILVRGEWQGSISREQQGTHGFGYDPIFIDGASGLTAAQMALEQKQAVSHRGQAISRLLERLS